MERARLASSRTTRWLLLATAGFLTSCVPSSQLASFPNTAPLWVDPDRVPFEGKPSEFYTSQLSDGIDKTLLRPWAQLFAFEPRQEATNINTLDEVPDSSWFHNRIGRRTLSPSEWKHGPCQDPPPPPPWSVVGAKLAGASTGFQIESAAGKRYLIKFDNPGQGPRASAADVIVSRMYHAAGYFVPCNRIVTFTRATLTVAPGATRKDSLGVRHPLYASDLNRLLESIPAPVNGEYRALASQWLPGTPLGPWQFEQTRSDDPNDIVPHEDRRELRGLKLLAAWVGHKDQRSENTLASWIETTPGHGWVRHAFLDFGDSFGHFSQPGMLARRLAGHAHGFDLPQVATDLLTFGLIHRPYEFERFGPSGPIFAYFNVQRFRPGSWKSVFPNPAFSKMTERDAAWMARIIASFRREHLTDMIAAGLHDYPHLERELLRILLGRQQAIVRRYLMPLSPLHRPRVLTNRHGAHSLCFDDLSQHFEPKRPTRFRGKVSTGTGLARAVEARLDQDRVCVFLPAARSAPPAPQPVVVELASARDRSDHWSVARTFLYQQRSHSGGLEYPIVALQRSGPSSP